jgi:hypothetical protein
MTLWGSVRPGLAFRRRPDDKEKIRSRLTVGSRTESPPELDLSPKYSGRKGALACYNFGFTNAQTSFTSIGSNGCLVNSCSAKSYMAWL